MTQIGVVEHLKLENVTLSHQLTETQHRSIKDKERIAVQLQGIEVHTVSNYPGCLFNHHPCKVYSPYLPTNISCFNCGITFFLLCRLTC